MQSYPLFFEIAEQTLSQLAVGSFSPSLFLAAVRIRLWGDTSTANPIPFCPETAGLLGGFR
jgi:hypothetical protein